MDEFFFHPAPEASVPEDGPLRGLRIAVQPNLSVAGRPADAGSSALAGFTALEDATIVRRLRRAGAALCGPTRMSEFGFGLQRSLAGDAVRQLAADAELVLDLMGESRAAAARAAVFGFKPSWGLLSRVGLIGLIPSMECCGLLSADTDHIRRILEVVAGPDGLDFSLSDEEVPDFSPRRIDPARTSVGVIAEALSGLPAADEEMFRASVDELRAAGFTLREMSFPDFPLFSPVHRIVGSVEASSCAGRYDSVRYGRRAPGAGNWNEMYLLSRGAAFGPLVKSYLFQGAFFQFERYRAFEDACRIRGRLLADMDRLVSGVDFLMLPAASSASAGASGSLADTCARFSAMAFANVTGQPALYVPPAPGRGRAGFQLAGPRRGDARLLALGAHLPGTRRGGEA